MSPKSYLEYLKPAAEKWRSSILFALVARLALLMVIYSLCRVLYYVYNADLFQGMDWNRFSRILTGGIRFDLAAILYLNAVYILMMTVPIKARFRSWWQRSAHWLFMFVNILGITVNMGDMVYYRTTLRRTTLSAIDQFSNETNHFSVAIRILVDYWPATLALVSICVLLWLLSRRLKVKGPLISNTYVFHISGLVTFVIVWGLFIAGVRGGFRHSTRPITVSNAAAYATVPEDVYLVVNTPFSMIRTATTEVIRKVNYFTEEQELEKVYSPIHRPSPDGPSKRMNVVVIIMESFSMEFSGYLNRWADGGNYRGYTPFLDSLMAKGVTWQYAFANGRKSIDAMPSVLCGIPSIDVPFVLSHYSNNRVNSVASLLHEKGYSSAFFHGAPNGSMGFDAFAKQAGFQRYYGMTEYGNEDDSDGIWGIWDLEFLQFSARQIDKLPQPFVSSIFTLSSHHPFEIPERFKSRFKAGENRMYQTVQYTDYALRKFFEYASRQSWFENTLFVLTADHVSSEVTMPEYKTAWGQYAIPIIFYGKGIEPAFHKDRIAQQTDILPSILSLLNYDRPFLAFGKDLFSDQDNFAVNHASAAYQVFSGNLLLRFDGEKEVGTFDYRGDRLLKTRVRPTSAGMEKFLKAFLQQYKNRMVDNRLIVP